MSVSAADAAMFQTARPRLYGIACRVLGSASEAEDVVQETWIRWQATDRSEVRDAGAFLATATTRLAINVVQSARSRRETPIGPSLVDQVDAAANPSLEAEQREALEAAVRRLLQKLSPAERAAYVLREAFDYSYRRISLVLAVSEANARQLVARARRRLCSEHRRPVFRAELQAFLDAFVAARTGDLATLEQLLTIPGVTSRASVRSLLTHPPSHRKGTPLCRPRSSSSTARSPSRRAGTASSGSWKPPVMT